MPVFRLRYLGPVIWIALCLVVLCAFTAFSLFHQQATIAGVLRENVSSRRAAADLRGSLNTLIALETHRVESVADLHTRAQSQVAEIQRFADQPEEQAISAKLDAGFAEYLRRWQGVPPPGHPEHEARVAEATGFLETNVLFPCRDYEEYNDHRIEDTLRQHERVLRQLAWGMAGVAVLGGFAGLVLGYGVARGLSRSIRRLQVQIRDAAGKLGPDLHEIVLTEQGDFSGLEAELDRLTGRIEEAVETLRQRDREVLRAEQLAAVGQLAAGVAHEINNPLTSIKMLVQAGQEEDGGGLATEDLRVIEAEVRRMEQSLQSFLDFARPSKPERRFVAVGPLVRGVADLVRGRAAKQRVTLRADAHADGPIIVADGGQLRQVLVNLVLNALDVMPTGGTLTVYVRPRPGDRVDIEVSDTGPGIPRAVMPRLFQPFVSSKDTGLGLGLVISKRIVEDHGGAIAAANRPGGGATFIVTLPKGDADANAAGR